MSIQDAKDASTLKRADMCVKRADDYLRMRPGTTATGVVSDLRDMVKELREMLSRTLKQEQQLDKPFNPYPPRRQG